MTINPFYAARHQGMKSHKVASSDYSVQQPRYARLPQIPVNTSPVPRLISLYHHTDVGAYGSRAYPGNCGGHLIRDLLLYFKPSFVCDPMSGSGTCREVCEDLGITCLAWDIHQGQDACAAEGFAPDESVDFVWAHPPYWRQKLYAEDERDLSRTPTLEAFLRRYAQFIRNAARAHQPGGHLAILMGDYQDREAGYVPLTYHTKRLAFAERLIQPCTDIIRFSHGASSGRKTYRSSFIPGLHDTCMIFRKPIK